MNVEVGLRHLEDAIDQVESVSHPVLGIYGPQTISWEIAREASLFLGGGRAALLQLAHPAVACAIDQHSNALEDLRGRFVRTFRNVWAIVFGDLDEAFKAARQVHRVHSRIRGTYPETVGPYREGDAYCANDPAALLWVYATLVDSSVRVFELVVRPLSGMELESHYQETKRFAYLFGVPEALLPNDWDDFVGYFRDQVEGPAIQVGSSAREISGALFRPPVRLLAPLFHYYRDVTSALLPSRIARQFGLSYGARESDRLQRVSGMILRVLPLLPDRLRFLPAYHSARRRCRTVEGMDKTCQSAVQQ